MVVSIHYLLIKYKRGPCEALLEIKKLKKVKKHVPFMFLNKGT
jgi:hypothetical protein